VILRLLQTSCALLVVASLVALSQPTPVIVAHDGAAPVASVRPAVPTEWSPPGPLEIPTIGVVPPGSENWFDPKAEPTFEAPRDTVPAAPEVLPPTSPPAAATSSAAPTPPTTQPTEAPTTETPTTETPTTETPTTETPANEAPATETPADAAPPTETEPPPTTEPPPAPTPPAPATNGRGNVVLAVGEELTMFDDATGAPAFTIAVKRVAQDVVCTEPGGTPAANGHLIAVRVHVTTGPGLAALGGEPAVRAERFRFLAPDGGTLTEVGTPAADACLPDREEFPAGPLAPGQDLAGVVVLDVPATAGRLVFAPGFLPVGGEWKFEARAGG
jgi:hypothetical protein